MSTACQCEGPQDGAITFACARHGIEKTAHWHSLCKNRPDYFQAWEEGRGPGQITADNAEKAPAQRRPPEARSVIERMLRQQMDDSTPRTWADIRRTLDRCFAGCEWLESGTCTFWSTGLPCQRRQQWVDVLLFNDCEAS